MQDDPKAMSEEEKAKFYEQAKTLLAEHKKTTSPVNNQQETTKTFNIPQNEQQATTPPPNILDPKQLKDIFDKMTEIDSDPNSKRAQEYYQRLEEIERKNPNKKKSQIIIKTMKRGRTVSQ
jgi:alpha-beta hydrolase superfamily lysophospholipase